jgi:ketosteroid isomerase-like protein
MDAVERLLAERAIERAVLDYAAHNDAANWDALADLFVPDARMSRPSAPDDFVEGRDAIVTAFKARPARTARHVIVNLRIDVDGNTARAESTLVLYTTSDGPPMIGGYSDRLINTPEGWRFVERRGRLDFAKA